MAYPTNIDSPGGTAALGTSLLAVVDHALDHRTLGSAVVAIENKLGIGSGSAAANQILVGSGAGTASWGTIWNGANLGSATLGTPTIDLGTANAQGDLFYRSAGGTITRLGIGTNTQVLTTNGTVPMWGTAASGGGSDGTFQGDFANYVHGGATIGTAASLVGTVASGTMYYSGTQYITTAGTHTYVGTQDTYVDIDPINSTYTYSGTSNGGSAPALAGTSIRIAKVVTSASAITGAIQGGLDSLSNRIYPISPIQLDGVSVYKSSTQSVANNTVVTITFDKENFKTNTIMHDNVTNNTRLVVPSNGFYLLNYAMTFAPGFTSTRVASLLNKNGVTIQQIENSSSDTTAISLINTIVTYLANGDYVEAAAYQNSGTAQTINSGSSTGCIFTMAKISG